MQRTLLAVASLLALVASSAQAQFINRDRSGDKADKPAAEAAPAASDDDDILAPLPEEQGAPKASAPSRAKAVQVGLVDIVPLGEAGKPAADQVTAGLARELGEGAPFGVVPLAVEGEAGASAGDKAASNALAAGTKSLERARALLQKLQFGNARKAFDKAVATLQKAAPVLTDPTPLVDAHLGLAEVAMRQGKDKEAKAQLALAAALNPELTLDKKRYPPLFITAHQEARDAILEEQRGSIVVDASGAAAAVEIDGRETDRAPVEVSGLPRGPHLVRVLREGLPAFGVIVEVKPGEKVTVSPGFVSAESESAIADLQNNRLGPAAAKSVAAAAKAQGLKAAIVGVVANEGERLAVQLVFVDAATAHAVPLPSVTLQPSLVDVTIEILKAREAIAALAGAKPPKATAAPVAPLLADAQGSAALETATVAMRYDVRAARSRPGSRVVGGAAGSDDEEGGRSVLSAGRSGTRQRLVEEDDPYAQRETAAPPADPDAPLMQQPWFWPTVIGGAAAAAVVVGSATAVTLVATKVLPDPRPADGAQIRVSVP